MTADDPAADLRQAAEDYARTHTMEEGQEPLATASFIDGATWARHACCWRQIETAPKAHGLVGVNMLVAALSGANDGTFVVGEAERDEDGAFWWAQERGDYHASPITHRVRYWQPLPAPPVNRSSANGQ